MELTPVEVYHLYANVHFITHNEPKRAHNGMNAKKPPAIML